MNRDYCALCADLLPKPEETAAGADLQLLPLLLGLMGQQSDVNN